MMLPADAATVLLPFINEAVRDFGPWVFVPVAVGAAAYEMRRKLQAKDAQIDALHHRIADLQERRLQDARRMIEVAEAGTAATAARTESDRRFADLLETMLRHDTRAGMFGRRR